VLAQIQGEGGPVPQVNVAAAKAVTAITVASQAALANEQRLADAGAPQQLFVEGSPEPAQGFRWRIRMHGDHCCDSRRQQDRRQLNRLDRAGRFIRPSQHDQTDTIAGQQGRQRRHGYKLGIAAERRVQVVTGLEPEQRAALPGIVAKVALQMHGGKGSPGGPGVVQLPFQRRQGRGV